MDYRSKKSSQITQAVRKNVFGLDSSDISKEDAFDEMINQLKDKFNSPTTERNDQLRILSVLPKSWTLKKIAEEFNAPIYMIRQVKELVSDQGILCTASARSGHGISEADKQTVKDFFFDNDEISRPMPGSNDYVSVFRNGQKEHIQKRLLMMSLKEAFLIFEEKLNEIDIGFTSFTQLCRIVKCINCI